MIVALFICTDPMPDDREGKRNHTSSPEQTNSPPLPALLLHAGTHRKVPFGNPFNFCLNTSL